MKKTKALLAIRNQALRDIIIFSLESNFNFNVSWFNNSIDATKALENESFSLVLSEYKLNQGNGGMLFKEIISKYQNIAFILIDDKEPNYYSDFNQGNLNGYVKRTQCVEPLKEIITTLFEKQPIPNSEPYCRVTTRTLMFLDSLDEDVFIKLITGRILKLFRKGDKVTKEDVERYQKKGVDDLYLMKETAIWVLKQINEKMPEIIKQLDEEEAKDLISSVKQISTASQKEEAKSEKGPSLDSSQNSPDDNKQQSPQKVDSDQSKKPEEDSIPTNGPINIEKEIAEIVQTKVKNVMGALKKKPQLARFLKSLRSTNVDDDYLKVHIGLLCNICTATAKEMGWSNASSLEKIIGACLLHDLLMSEYPDLAKIQTEKQLKDANLNEELRTFVYEHPKETAALIRDLEKKIMDIPMGVAPIIEQHHELPDGSGFPRKLHAARILPMAAMFIVCHFTVNFIIDNKDKNRLNFDQHYKDIKIRFKGGPFTKVVENYKKVIEQLKAAMK